MVSWAEEPTPREWQFYAVCSQLRADQRRLERAQERREFWRVVRCDLAAAVGIMLAVAVAYVGIWWLWALVTP
jgi:fatty acid desaturase